MDVVLTLNADVWLCFLKEAVWKEAASWLVGHPVVLSAGVAVADGSSLPSLRVHMPAAHMPVCSKVQRGKFRAQTSYFRVQPHASSRANTFT